MRTANRFLALGLGLGWGTLSALGCEPEPEVDIALSMTMPQGILDEATGMKLWVFPAEGRSCRDDGSPSELPGTAQEFAMKRDGCDEGVAWCSSITLPRDESEQMFAVQASNASGILAQGCATAKIDQDPLDVSIKVVRYVAPACCGDGLLQTGELCDTGPQGGTCGSIEEDEICAASCSTKAVPVDRESSATPTAYAGQGELALTFAPGKDQLSGGLRAAYATGGSTGDIGLRFFQSDLSTVTVPSSLSRPHVAIFGCSGNDTSIPRLQKSPAVAPTPTGSVVAFLSSKDSPQRADVAIVAMSDIGCSAGVEETLSDKTTAAASVDVATDSEGKALVVWEQAGAILATTWTDASGATAVFSIASAGKRPRVARASSGWVVVYEGGDDDILAARIGDNLAVGEPIVANAKVDGVQDQPDVAVAANGAWIVVWRSGAEVLFQRFGASDAPVAGDQETALATTSAGTRGAPTITSGGTFFLAAWESGAEVRARLLGVDGGFVFNPVSGQNDDFVATTGATTPRAPAVAVGAGAMAIGWQEESGSGSGIYVRRFPLPTP